MARQLVPIDTGHGRVWNRRDPNTPPDAIYIGRGHGSAGYFGNPFSHLPDTIAECKVATRDEAISAFESWARHRVTVDREFRLAVDLLAGADLVCWCAPSPCHGVVLLNIADEIRAGLI